MRHNINRMTHRRQIAPDRIRCQGTVDNRLGRCPNAESVAIDGKRLCTWHAQKEALARMIEDGTATILKPRRDRRAERTMIAHHE